MGYDLHITRAEHWAENRNAYITADEWSRLVGSDTELTPDPRNGPHFVVWSGPSEYDEPWFDWSDGNIYAKYPDAPMLGKMLQIAARLSARVQGDDGEVYTRIEDHPGPTPQSRHQPEASQSTPSYVWRERFWNLLVYGIVALVIAAAVYFDLW